MDEKLLLKVLELSVPVLAGGMVALLAERVGRWMFSPTVRVDFDSSENPAYFAITPEGGTKQGNMSAWVRVRVRNIRGATARGCRGYLAKVEEWDENERKFKQGWYFDISQLAWSSRLNLAYDPVDLPRGIDQFLDVVSSRGYTAHPQFRVETQFKPLREIALGMEKGLFRFTIVVAGDNFKPRTFQLRYRWTGRWQAPEVSAASPN